MSNISDDQACSEPWYSQNNLLKDFQRYLGIFNGIDVFPVTLTGVQLRWKGEASLDLLENRKNYHDFGKKGPDFIRLWVMFPIQNIFLRVSRRKNSKILHCRPFFLVFLTKCLSKCPSSTTFLPPALKSFWLRTCTHTIFFLKNAPS